MAVTETRSVLFDLNVAYDLSLISRGYRLPLRWHDDHRPVSPCCRGTAARYAGSTSSPASFSTW